MTSLSLIETEAQRLLGRLPETERLAQQRALVDLCETHWHELRGSQPGTALANILWSITPPLADLLLDLYAKNDARLNEFFAPDHLARGLALLVIAEIESGNEAGVHIAHEPMMAFETATPPTTLLDRIAALLRGTLESPLLHKHDKHHDAMWKALAVIAAATRRLDLPAALAVIRLLSSGQSSESGVIQLREDVAEVGVRFIGMDDEHVDYELHGHQHKPIRARNLGEMLFEIRQMWLG
jgi:hypothetical protein